MERKINELFFFLLNSHWSAVFNQAIIGEKKETQFKCPQSVTNYKVTSDLQV